MTERETLIRLDKDLGQARYRAYILLELDESLGERLDAKLREVSLMVKRRLRRLDRRRR